MNGMLQKIHSGPPPHPGVGTTQKYASALEGAGFAYPKLAYKLICRSFQDLSTLPWLWSKVGVSRDVSIHIVPFAFSLCQLKRPAVQSPQDGRILNDRAYIVHGLCL